MKLPKKLANGQTIQENMEPSGLELAPTNAPTGDKLQTTILDGKAGKAESIGLPQTDFTSHKGGPAPETSATNP